MPVSLSRLVMPVHPPASDLFKRQIFFFFQAQDGIRYLVRSRGLGDVYKRQVLISLVPNLVPLVATAGLMGFMDIPIKPSTILVFLSLIHI